MFKFVVLLILVTGWLMCFNSMNDEGSHALNFLKRTLSSYTPLHQETPSDDYKNCVDETAYASTGLGLIKRCLHIQDNLERILKQKNVMLYRLRKLKIEEGENNFTVLFENSICDALSEMVMAEAYGLEKSVFCFSETMLFTNHLNSKTSTENKDTLVQADDTKLTIDDCYDGWLAFIKSKIHSKTECDKWMHHNSLMSNL